MTSAGFGAHTRRPKFSRTPYLDQIRPPSPSGLRCFGSIASRRVPHSLTHLDGQGRASMVDVGEKNVSKRVAVATGRIYIPLAAYELVVLPHDPRIGDLDHSSAVGDARLKAQSKGDVLGVAQLAGIMGCKRTSELIPLCHPLILTRIKVTLTPEVKAEGAPDKLSYSIFCRAEVSCMGKTGVEMEALTGVSVALLTVWDMLKAVAGREMLIGDIKVEHKAGGRSGDFTRDS